MTAYKKFTIALFIVGSIVIFLLPNNGRKPSASLSAQSPKTPVAEEKAKTPLEEEIKAAVAIADRTPRVIKPGGIWLADYLFPKRVADVWFHYGNGTPGGFVKPRFGKRR